MIVLIARSVAFLRYWCGGTNSNLKLVSKIASLRSLEHSLSRINNLVVWPRFVKRKYVAVKTSTISFPWCFFQRMIKNNVRIIIIQSKKIFIYSTRCMRKCSSLIWIGLFVWSSGRNFCKTFISFIIYFSRKTFSSSSCNFVDCRLLRSWSRCLNSETFVVTKRVLKFKFSIPGQATKILFFLLV